MEQDPNQSLTPADRTSTGERLDDPAARSVVKPMARFGDDLVTFRQAVGGPDTVWSSWLSVIVFIVFLALFPIALFALATGFKLWQLIGLLICAGVLVVSFVTAHLYKRRKQRRARELESLGDRRHAEVGR